MQHILFSSSFVCSLHVLPIPLFLSLSLSAGFFPSRCAGCWPPSTTGGLKLWCCASPGRTRLTWQQSRVEFLQVRKISGGILNKTKSISLWIYFFFCFIHVIMLIILIHHLYYIAVASWCVMKWTCNEHRDTDSHTKTQRSPFNECKHVLNSLYDEMQLQSDVHASLVISHWKIDKVRHLSKTATDDCFH